MTRLVAHRPLPPYGYVPGRTPHPVSDPAGHSFGKEGAAVTFDPERWWECEEYLYGFDLFNAGYYWEAHEAWEACWHAVGRTGVVADVLKGLIRLAACGVKAREGRRDGVTSHAAAAARLFRGVMGFRGLIHLGLDLLELTRLVEGAEPVMRLADEPPARRVFGFEVTPVLERRPRPDLSRPPERDEEAVEKVRQMSSAEKLAEVDPLTSEVRAVLAAEVRMQHPDWREDQISREVARRFAAVG